MSPYTSVAKRRLLIFGTVTFLAYRAVTGTVIYDYSSTVTLKFDVPWVSVEHITTPSPFPAVGGGVTGKFTITDGAATAFSSFAEIANLSNNSYTQISHVTGSAGDSTFTNSGASRASSSLYNLFTFDFGQTPTDFTITLAAEDLRVLSSVDAPASGLTNFTGEDVGGSVGFQAILLTANGRFSGIGAHGLDVGESVTVPGLTGVHTFRFGTFAETKASALYPLEVPEDGCTFGLMILALLTCRVAVRALSDRRVK